LAVVKYVIGFIESNVAIPGMASAFSSFDTYCVFPGNKKSGYCLEKLKAFISWFFSNSRYKEALNCAIPPRKG
jgi:hypothetical protein